MIVVRSCLSRLTALVLAAGLAVTGCQAAGSAPESAAVLVQKGSPATAPTTPGTVATASSAGQRNIPASAFANLKPFTGPAVAQYGQDTLGSAYRQMVNFAFTTGWDPALIAKNAAQLSRADLAPALAVMTPTCRKQFLDRFGKAVSGDKTAARGLEEAIFFGVTGPNGLKPVQRGTVVADRRFTEAAVAVDRSPGKRLSMSFAARANILMRDNSGRHMMLRTSRVLHYLLVPNTATDHASRPFLIDSWSIKMTVNPPEAAP